MRTLSVPELRQQRLAGLAVAHEGAARCRFGVVGMVVEQAGFEVGDDADAGVVEAAHQPLRVGILGAVPMEDVALWADGCVAGAHVEGADGDLLGAAAVDERLHPRLRVVRVGDRHRGLGVAERPARRQGGAAGQPQEARRKVGETAAGKDVIVEVATLGLVAAEEAVVVVVLRPEVERRLGSVVVEHPVDRTRRPVAREQERPVLVERVTSARVVAERVAHRDPQPPPVQVERPGLVAKAVVAILGCRAT